jgi:hypothetical protein
VPTHRRWWIALAVTALPTLAFFLLHLGDRERNECDFSGILPLLSIPAVGLVLIGYAVWSVVRLIKRARAA